MEWLYDVLDFSLQYHKEISALAIAIPGYSLIGYFAWKDYKQRKAFANDSMAKIESQEPLAKLDGLADLADK